MARRYVVQGRTFTKVAAHPAGRPGPTHVVEDGNFWKGNRSWEHRALCGASITGIPVSRQRVDCQACRKAIEAIKEASQR